ncbi:hypothetical protein NDR87_01395 [Nocardia sp. CDC159]|uniref:Uncharacterized protein n=1 Tax=Nocardia pulmonis TaxID=2951408 RepID=A0A9X2E3V6_9NOCA|nr:MULTISPECIES: hypothetical protein [Nocardia]MCM6772335.1 hypothetical protein [Nocardia pulmonis]MCM6785007.1 hypothetical protein [Nocardia sp. CDC159]
MSDRLLARAETTKLARLLDISDPAELEFLTELSPEAIRQFRERATDALFDADAAKLKRIAAATKLVPTPIAAKAAERAFGPGLCAAVAAQVEPARAVDIAKALPAPFLAEATIQLDPRRTADIIPRVPIRLVVAVTRELLTRGEHVTLGRFVGVASPEMMRAAAQELGDADLLRTGYLLEDKSSMDVLLEIVADRLPGVVRAAHEQRLWAEGIDLLATVSPANRARIGDLSAQLGDEVLDGLVQAVLELDAWTTLLPVTAAMSAESLAVFAQRPIVHTAPVLTAIMDVALDHGLWLDLLPLAVPLPAEPLAFIAARVAAKSDDKLSDLILRAHAADLWDAMIPLALAMTESDRRRMAGLPVMQDPEVLRAITATCARHELWSRVLPLVDALPEAGKKTLGVCLAELTDEQVRAAVLAAADSANFGVLVDLAIAEGLWLELLPCVTELDRAPREFVAARVASHSDERLSELVRAAAAAGRWDALIPVALAMSDADRRRVAGLPLLADPQVLRQVIDTAAAHELWAEVLPLVDALPPEVKPTIAACLGELPRGQLLSAVRAAAGGDDLPALVEIALAQDEPGRARVLDLIDGMPDLDEFLTALDADTPEAVWDAFAEVRSEIPAGLRDRLADRALRLGRPGHADRLAGR